MAERPWVHSGRVFRAEEIAGICATVAWLPGLVRKEVAATVSEHLGWHTVTGTAKLHACGELLVRLEAAGLLELPALRPAGRQPRVTLAAPPEAAAETPMCVPLSALGPVRLEVVRAPPVLRQNATQAKGAPPIERTGSVWPPSAPHRRIAPKVLLGAAQCPDSHRRPRLKRPRRGQHGDPQAPGPPNEAVGTRVMRHG